jgi:branched-chain amino acid transport system ATP-binding protein
MSIEAGVSTQPSLICREVGARYGLLEACRNISLQVNPGEIVALIGPNGAGKTSFIGALNGTVSGSGEALLNGHNLMGMATHRRSRAGLATVPEGRGLFPTLTIGENLALGARLAPSTERAAAIEEAAGRFGFIRERWNTAAGSLSGGEQQMVAVAKCLAGRPTVLLLDEPSQGLAPIIVGELAEALNGLRTTGLAILLVEQNQTLVSITADRFVLLASGQIVSQGGRAELADRERMATAYFK